MSIDYDIGMYEGVRRVLYDGSASGNGNAVFVPICEKCGRFVKADASVSVNDHDGLKDAPNATCKKCGRVQMIFEGFFSDDELG